MSTLRLQRIEKLKGFLEKDPKDSFTKFALALEYVNISEYYTALTLFEDLQKEDPNYVGLYYHLGKLHETMNESAKAISTYKKGIEVAQKVSDAHAASELNEALQDLQTDQ